jgi:CRISPR-associated protein Csm1
MNRIEHIFNEHKGNKNKEYINSQEFEVDYIKNYNGHYKHKNFESDNDFEKQYYYALQPSNHNSIISKYDDEKIDKLLDSLGENLIMISGDFWGIQKFIFDTLNSSKASKILRSRSTIIQLITYVISDIIKREFFGSNSVLFGAGKFLILAKSEDNYKDKIKLIQEEINNYFLKNYFGQNGFILSYTKTTKSNILNQNSQEMKENLESLASDNEIKKLNKFNFLKLEDSDICKDIFSYKDDEVCNFCNKRVATLQINDEKVCSVCNSQIILGEQIVTSNYIKISSEKISNIVIFKYKNSEYSVKFYKDLKDIDSCKKNSIAMFDISSNEYKKYPKWSLKSYVPQNINSNVKTFEEIAKGSSGLFALKADVDKLGDTFREYYMTSFKKFNRLSRELDFFFSDYITKIIEESYKNCYIVFAGGDDLFLIGEYKEVVKLAKTIRKEFYKFSLQKSTLSIGLVMFKPSTPINYISHLADEAESRAKLVTTKGSNLTRDGIDLFGISMKFDEFLKIEADFKEIILFLEENVQDSTTFYYRLLDFCDMKEHINQDIKNAMWKSKLNYVIRRNIDKGNNNFDIYKKLFNLIEEYGEKLKPSIFLKIYQNRDKTDKRRVNK